MIGKRRTQTRKKIFAAFNHFQKPISVLELYSFLHKQVDLTSIYRNLELMKKTGGIIEIDFGDGKKRYELPKNHHHHLICESCGAVKDLKINDESIFNKTKDQGFLIKKHRLEFFGLCKNCQ
ncbi:transcriptional repressor [Patescibacteria group bacterium]|nr:transcriptional repressor [Patescibacteria group bacterium]